MNIKPLGSMILLKAIEVNEKTTRSGLIVTAATIDSELKRGTVVALGSGDNDPAGNHYDIPLNIGDIVFYSENHATEVEEDNEKYFFVNWRQLLGVIEKENDVNN